METTIYCYTGTGNSLWTARKLSTLLNDSEVISTKLVGRDPIKTGSHNIGFIFPVHIWGIPSPVIDVLDRLAMDAEKYYFAIGVNAGQVAATLIQLKSLLEKRNIKLSSGFSICLPSNYIPWGGATSQEKQQKMFKNALDKINGIARIIRAQKVQEPEKGPLWQNIFFSAVYRKTFNRVPQMDKPFFADEKCNHCGICEKICPALNISLVDGKPVWQHRCEQCFACIQWCPEEAIQYGRGTAKKKRYHHPDITLKDMLACVPQTKK